MIQFFIPFVFAATTTFTIAPDKVPLANLQAQEYATSVFEGTPLMAVLHCESTQRQWDSDGNVLRGLVNRADVGIMQINETYHAKEAEDLGLDLSSAEGNIEFALWLYKHQGLRPWYVSKPCWSKLIDGS